MEPAAYVLKDFTKAEGMQLDEMIESAVAAVTTFVTSGIEVAMNHHNGSTILT
jgi:peptidyl-tRNA hydrolase